MPFSLEQISELNAPLSRSAVKQREQAGRKFSYVEGWHVIAEANRIFGFDRWTSKTVETCCVVERERLIGKQALPGWGVTYTAKVSIVVDTNDDHWITRDGCGTGHGIDTDLGLAHESAIKEAETDARKRALMTFGNPFGLALYDKEQAHVVDESELSRQRFIEGVKAKVAAFDDADRDAILRWWHSDEQRKARRDFDISPSELLELKSLVTAKAKLPPPGAA
jgi:recombination DNA repair RAD52 pathway protein